MAVVLPTAQHSVDALRGPDRLAGAPLQPFGETRGVLIEAAALALAAGDSQDVEQEIPSG